MKAIETRYAGCRFRSRLEARWAVFFDHLGIEWQYEPEGFEYSGGCPPQRYLPDFYLPGPDMWAEVKGSEGQLIADGPRIGWAIDYHNTPIADSSGLVLLGPIPRPHFERPGVHYHCCLYWYKGVESCDMFFYDTSTAEFQDYWGKGVWKEIGGPFESLISCEGGDLFQGHASISALALHGQWIDHKPLSFDWSSAYLAPVQAAYAAARSERFGT
jgi:hypothetical protein